MATYDTTAVSDAAIAHKKGMSLQTGRALRDNPQSVFEVDPSVPLTLLPTVLLGTLTTTSGTTQTLSGLVLAPYKFLKIVINGVSFTGSPTAIALAGQPITAQMVAVIGSGSWSGEVSVCLANGVATAMTQEIGQPGAVLAPNVGYSNATTSIQFSGGTFDAGSILVYGCK